MPMTNQRPARVSSDLRSSTLASVAIDTFGVESMSSGSAAAWVRWCSCGGSLGDVVALGVGGELEEQVLEAAVGGAQVGEDDRALGGRAADLDRCGVDAQAVAGGGDGEALGLERLA